MIHKVQIRSFKSLRDVSIELERFTVFVGANGSGKTFGEKWLVEGVPAK
jgi:AAA15 family ATPase/GTPase